MFSEKIKPICEKGLKVVTGTCTHAIRFPSVEWGLHARKESANATMVIWKRDEGILTNNLFEGLTGNGQQCQDSQGSLVTTAEENVDITIDTQTQFFVFTEDQRNTTV